MCIEPAGISEPDLVIITGRYVPSWIRIRPAVFANPIKRRALILPALAFGARSAIGLRRRTDLPVTAALKWHPFDTPVCPACLDQGITPCCLCFRRPSHSEWHTHSAIKIPIGMGFGQNRGMKADATVTEDLLPLSPRSRFQAAMILAVAADALQMIVFPLFAEGAWSPADDLLDVAVGAVLIHLLGWHWEFLPTLFAELVPGVDLVPFWTLAVANVYRKRKQISVTQESAREQRPALKGQQSSSDDRSRI